MVRCLVGSCFRTPHSHSSQVVRTVEMVSFPSSLVRWEVGHWEVRIEVVAGILVVVLVDTLAADILVVDTLAADILVVDTLVDHTGDCHTAVGNSVAAAVDYNTELRSYCKSIERDVTDVNMFVKPVQAFRLVS